MPTVEVGTLTFVFDVGWQASKYDDWAFYRQQFQRVRNGVKAVDILAVAPDRTVWFIEVKDYRHHPRTKPIELADEVACKVFDTLAALLPARIHGNVGQETTVASAALQGCALRVVLHLEQPARHSKLFPRAIDPANVRMKLRQLVKPIDPHPLVVETHQSAQPPGPFRDEPVTGPPPGCRARPLAWAT
jgi:hypothetical protein